MTARPKTNRCDKSGVGYHVAEERHVSIFEVGGLETFICLVMSRHGISGPDRWHESAERFIQFVNCGLAAGFSDSVEKSYELLFARRCAPIL